MITFAYSHIRFVTQIVYTHFLAVEVVVDLEEVSLELVLQTNNIKHNTIKHLVIMVFSYVTWSDKRERIRTWRIG